MDALAEVTTDVVNIWANNHYIGVLYDNMALVYTKEADVNTTNIQAYTNQAIWAELYYNNYAIVVYQNYSIVSFQFTEPSFTFSYQFTTTAQ